MKSAFRSLFRRFELACQSPIESMLLSATLQSESGLRPLGTMGTGLVYLVEVTETVDLHGASQRVVVYSQPEPDPDGERPKLHCDFGFRWIGQYSPTAYIELDGHDWHERTREQASRDRARDRRVLRAGGNVLRYTGSDVFGDPCSVILDITDTLFALEDWIDIFVHTANQVSA